MRRVTVRRLFLLRVQELREGHTAQSEAANLILTTSLPHLSTAGDQEEEELILPNGQITDCFSQSTEKLALLKAFSFFRLPVIIISSWLDLFYLILLLSLCQ